RAGTARVWAVHAQLHLSFRAPRPAEPLRGSGRFCEPAGARAAARRFAGDGARPTRGVPAEVGRQLLHRLFRLWQSADRASTEFGGLVFEGSDARVESGGRRDARMTPFLIFVTLP